MSVGSGSILPLCLPGWLLGDYREPINAHRGVVVEEIIEACVPPRNRDEGDTRPRGWR